ncbi:MAG TPA: hypothetical protein VFV23_06640 [Verrucomicrobiae bacterium]|nr:hypothetical protein [Verrucomicrobiae bacterium]
MSDNTKQLPVAKESLERKHEVSEKRVRNVLLVGAAAAFLTAFSLGISGVLMFHFAQLRPMQNMQHYGLILAPDLKPLHRFPGPDLSIDDDHDEQMNLHGSQNAQLNSYGWVDRSNGIVRIPIEHAMDLVLQRGLSATTNSHEKETPLQLRQKIPEQQ